MTIELALDEVWLLIGALEDALVIFDRLVEREELRILDVVGPAAGVGYQLSVLYGKLGLDSTGGDEDGQEAD